MKNQLKSLPQQDHPAGKGMTIESKPVEIYSGGYVLPCPGYDMNTGREVSVGEDLDFLPQNVIYRQMSFPR
jgi:hypothetical protein